tara:strand:+ start:371 stop:697 length:327 start_codon:yes stop_codon:yes gene_type:complete
MKDTQALDAFSALGHPTRLAIFRTLSSVAPRPIPAGELAQTTKTPPSTLSSHLQVLERSGLIVSQRRSRQILYALDIEGARDLVDFLTRDCCGGRPDICGTLPRKAAS